MEYEINSSSGHNNDSMSQIHNPRVDRPFTLAINKTDSDKENILTASSASSIRSDYSSSSFTTEDFEILRLKEGMDLDMVGGHNIDTAAEIYEHSDIDISPLHVSADENISTNSRYWSCDPSVAVDIRMGLSGPSSDEPMTVIQVFQQTVRENGDCLALAVKRLGMWKKWTYEEYYRDCVIAAKSFIKLGLQPHHSVCIIGFNAPEWHMSLIGAIMAGGIGVGLYLTCTPEGCYHVALTSKANIIVVENDSQLEKVLQVRDKLPDLKAIIHYSDLLAGKSLEKNVFPWSELVAMDTEYYEEEVETRMAELVPNKCCTLLYTSGTTGKPKGVMLSHDNVTWMSNRFFEQANCVKANERVISYLPLGHVAPQILDVFIVMATAGSCWFAQPNAMKGSLIETLKEVHPTLFLGVPRVWEKIAEGMQLVSRNTTGFKAWFRDWALGVGLKGNFHKQSGGTGTPIGWTLANAVVFNKVHKLLGLDQCHYSMTGSAPISQDTLAYFMSVNIPINEMYGMSECCSCCTVTTSDVIRFKAAGVPLPGVELRISSVENSDNGELQVKGRSLMMGYINDPESTARAFTNDGYLKSGDIGYISNEGFVYITGRMKEMIITARGDNIAPVPIEYLIKQDMPIISNVVLIGDQRDYLVCLISLKVEFDSETGVPTDTLNPTAKAVCSSMNVSAVTVSDIKTTGDGRKVLDAIQRAIDKANNKAPFKQHKVVKWSLLDRDFSIASGELSSTLKLKRKFIMEKYSDIIELLYTD